MEYTEIEFVMVSLADVRAKFNELSQIELPAACASEGQGLLNAV